jgi:hypothetical protein
MCDIRPETRGVLVGAGLVQSLVSCRPIRILYSLKRLFLIGSFPKKVISDWLIDSCIDIVHDYYEYYITYLVRASVGT